MTTININKNQFPIFDGLFAWPSDAPHLIGVRCKGCRSVSFPRFINRHRPNCSNRETEEILLSNKGVLRSYTIQRYQPPPLFKGPEPFEPYPIGSLELPEGIEIFGIIKDCPLDAIKVGMEMEIIFEKLYTDIEGKDRLIWKFRPLK